MRSYIALVAALVTAHWLHRRLERVERASGAWRVQEPPEPPPWDAPSWWAGDAFDRALAQWDRELGEDAA